MQLLRFWKMLFYGKIIVYVYLSIAHMFVFFFFLTDHLIFGNHLRISLLQKTDSPLQSNLLPVALLLFF